MNYYIILTEGPHDIAVIDRICKNKLDCSTAKTLDEVDMWKKLYQIKYPFVENHIYGSDNIAQVPVVLKNKDVSVAAFSAVGDSKIPRKLRDIYNSLGLDYFDQISEILIVCDADDNDVFSVKNRLKKEFADNKISMNVSEFELEILDDSLPENIKKKFDIYIFPNNCGQGAVEDMVLEAAQTEYFNLKNQAKLYLDVVAGQNIRGNRMNKARDYNKAWVGVIANVLKPGKANQVSIHDDKWITKESIRRSKMLQKFSDFLCEHLK